MAESMAMRHIPMTMEDWAKRIDKFINLFESPILQDNGQVSAEYAKEFAESEFEKYRIIQDRPVSYTHLDVYKRQPSY